MFVHRPAHLAPSLLADLRSTQNVLVDDFLTGLLSFVRDEQGRTEPQCLAASSSKSPKMSLSDLIEKVGMNVANSFCQTSGTTPSEAAASTTNATENEGYGHGLLKNL